MQSIVFEIDLWKQREQFLRRIYKKKKWLIYEYLYMNVKKKDKIYYYTWEFIYNLHYMINKKQFFI